MATDFELLEAWRAGDREAGSELFERHFVSLRRFFANKVAGARQEDLIQQTFLVCVEKQDDFEGRSSFRSYLFGIAHNVLRNAYRKGRREADRLEFGTVSVEDLRTGAISLVARRQEQQLLLAALRRIPVDYQVALELYYWEHLEGEELAEVLQVPLGTVRTRLRRGKQRLEAAVKEIADSPQQQTQTLENLEAWARDLREKVKLLP